MRRYRNSEILQAIDENVHSAQGREALKLKYIDGLTLLEISERLNIPYSTLTDRYYKRWLPELFADFSPE